MSRVEVAVVGGGPVGLLLGCLLADEGVRVAVLERRRQRSTHSRSIGVHPPALEVAARLGLAEPFVTRGVRVERGHAYAGRTRLGTLSFRSCPPPYRFVLTLPQAEGERLLERRLASLPSGELCRGVEVVALERSEANVRLRFADGGALEAALVVGCDGHDSAVRGWLELPFEERRYPDRFMMGDFPDDTRLGWDAAIYLTAGGVVESFPLPDGLRRWVAAVSPGGGPAPEPRSATDRRAAGWLADRVLERVGERLDAHDCSMVSAFGVRTLLVRRLVAGRVALAGDAAHVLPPFGGQGMNLGWLDAGGLAARVLAARAGRDLAQLPVERLQRVLAGYEAARLPAARTAARRAVFNLRVGRASPAPSLRAAAVWAALRTPLAGVFARRFTMRGLGTGRDAGLDAGLDAGPRSGSAV